MKKMPRKLRSLWGVTPIINIIHNARAESLLGIESDTLVFSNYHTTNRFKYNFSRWCKTQPMKLILPFFLFPWALFHYDIFHFYFDRGILPSWKWRGINPFELWLLKKLGKKVFVYTYGADIRTRKITEALGGYHACLHCPAPGKFCVCSEEKHFRNYNRVCSFATEIFSMGDMTEDTPGSYNALFFWPVDVEEVPYVGPAGNKRGTVNIVHSPNHRFFKGTDYLIKVVEKLKKEGLPIELNVVERVSNERALEMYCQADILAEQFLIGWHGFTAIEAMALGKPVISYIRKREYLLQPDECPIVSANPDELEEVLRDLAQHPEKREWLGRRGREYVEKYFSLAAFAERLRKIYLHHGILNGASAVAN